MSDIKCEYCGKGFSSLFNLNKHKKTAGYCLEIQKNQFKVAVDIGLHICEYCEQEFTTKSNYQTHLGVCKAKKESDRIAELNNLKIELNQYKAKNEMQAFQLVTQEKDLVTYRLLCEEKDRQLVKYEHEIECIKMEKNEEIECAKMEKNEEIERIKMEKNEEIEHLKQQIREKDEHIQNTPHTTIYQTNNNNSKYEFNFQAVFDKLPPFTDENIKERVGSILPRNLIEANDYNLLLNFCSNFGRKIADMVILTDKSRGLIFIKNKDGEKEKHQVKGFINKCLVIGHPECMRLFNSTRNVLEQFSVRGDIMPEDEAKCYGDMTILREYLTTSTLDKTVKTISNILTDNCTYISKLLPGTVEYKMIEEITE